MLCSKTAQEQNQMPGVVEKKYFHFKVQDESFLTIHYLRESNFINDSLRNEFHKRFMDKYIK